MVLIKLHPYIYYHHNFLRFTMIDLPMKTICLTSRLIHRQLSLFCFSKVLVLYGGNELFDYEVEAIFWSDVGLAVFALFAVLLVMIVMTSFSLSLTFMGIWCIALSFPLAMFFYRAVFKIVGLGIMNGAAAFVIIGIGMCMIRSCLCGL